jgi:ribosome biogenesis GTPase / thiamine phosphate phosphatase
VVTGTVLEREGSTYRVLTADGEVRAVLRGKMKRQTAKVVVGDRVRLDLEGEHGVLGIAGVEARSSLLARRVPEGRGTRAVAANVDQVLVLTATRDPEPIPQLVDRLLVVAEANNIPAGVILNKCDLDPGDALAARFAAAGYEVFRTSAKTGEGLDRLRDCLAGRESVVTGPSGAGKSSLLNALEPGLKLRTGVISRRIRRGTNTTVSAVMVPLSRGGFLVDTPGFSEVGLWGLEPGELAHCFPEFRPLVDQCRFPDCSHTHEPGCAIITAAASGSIPRSRLESYRALLSELQQIPKDWE